MSGARLFGKLPAHGDFVARGLGAAERGALDTWLSGEMLAARDALVGAFEDRYDRAPPWRFVGPGRSGVLIASIDAVGRRFPLYLALGAAAGNAAEQIEELAYRAFGENWDADALVAEIDALVAASEGNPAATRWWTLGAPAALHGERPVGLLVRMLNTEVNA